MPVHAPAEGDVAVTLALVQRAQAGDAEAFGELYDRYVDLRLPLRLLPRRLGAARRGPHQRDVPAGAAAASSSFTWQGRDVGAWFVTIARNLIADHYKSSRYRLELTTDDMTPCPRRARDQDGPEGAVLEAMQNKVLLEAVKQLDAEQQECIVLRFLQGLSVARDRPGHGQERRRDQGAAVPRDPLARPAAPRGGRAVGRP